MDDSLLNDPRYKPQIEKYRKKLNGLKPGVIDFEIGENILTKLCIINYVIDEKGYSAGKTEQVWNQDKGLTEVSVQVVPKKGGLEKHA